MDNGGFLRTRSSVIAMEEKTCYRITLSGRGSQMKTYIYASRLDIMLRRITPEIISGLDFVSPRAGQVFDPSKIDFEKVAVFGYETTYGFTGFQQMREFLNCMEDPQFEDYVEYSCTRMVGHDSIMHFFSISTEFPEVIEQFTAAYATTPRSVGRQ